MLKKSCTLLVFSLISALAMAQPGERYENEDLQFIKEWVRDQSITALAHEVNLTADQVATLRTIKGQVDGVEAEFEPRFEALRASAEASAAEIRARIEQTNTLSDADKAILDGLRDQRQGLVQEKRGALGEASSGLAGLLTEAQLQIIRENRPRAEEGDGPGPGDRGPAAGGPDAEGAGPQGLAAKAIGRHKAGPRAGGQHPPHLLARLLLSDAFLAAYN